MRVVFIDRWGNNWGHDQVLELLKRRVGATDSVLDHVKIGGIYSNGTIWFQRVS